MFFYNFIKNKLLSSIRLYTINPLMFPIYLVIVCNLTFTDFLVAGKGPEADEDTSTSILRNYNSSDEKFILSMDGSINRSIIPIRLLSRIEEDLQNRYRKPIYISEIFDLITGSSFSGVIALGLSIRISAKSLVNFLKEDCAKVFGQSIWRSTWISLLRMFYPEYSSMELESQLKHLFGERRLKELSSQTIIPAFDLEMSSTYFFDSRDSSVATRDFLIRDVGRATSAIPTYFPAATISNINNENRTFIDGSLTVPNPTEIAFENAHENGANNLFVVSLGTGTTPSESLVNIKRGGILQWITPIINIMYSALNRFTDQRMERHARKLRNNSLNLKYLRIQPVLPNSLLSGSDFTLETLNNLIRYADKIFEGHDGTNSQYCNLLRERIDQRLISRGIYPNKHLSERTNLKIARVLTTKRLILEGPEITTDKLELICNELSRKKNISKFKSLLLLGTDIDDKGVYTIVSRLLLPYGISKLVLDGSVLIGSQGVLALCNLLKSHNPPLKKLSMQRMELVDEAGYRLTRLCIENELIRELRLGGNKFSEEAKNEFLKNERVKTEFKTKVLGKHRDKGREKLSLALKEQLFLPSKLLHRQNSLDQIAKLFHHIADYHSSIVPVVILREIGGSGKTTLARMFAKENDAEVIWEFDAKDSTSLYQSYVNLAAWLAANEEEKREVIEFKNERDISAGRKRLLLFIWRQLQSYSWLFIFRRVIAYPELKEYLPRSLSLTGYGKVIITTRDSSLTDNIEGEEHLIESLDERDKLSLYQSVRYSKNEKTAKENEQMDREAIIHIAPFPLDVVFAGRYALRSNISLPEYLKRMERNRERFKTRATRIFHKEDTYDETRFTLISVPVDTMTEENPELLEPLLFLSMLDSQEIPRSLLASYLTSANEDLIDDINFYFDQESLFSIKTSHALKEERYSFHPSIHKFLREHIIYKFHNKLNYMSSSPDKKEDASSFLEDTIRPMAEAFHSLIENVDRVDLSNIRLMARHGKAFLNSFEELFGSNLNFLSIASLYRRVGVLFNEIGEYTITDEFANEAYRRLIPLNPSNSEFDLMELYQLIGNRSQYSGEYENALKNQKKCLELREKIYGKENINILMALNNVGAAFLSLGMHKDTPMLKKEEYFQEAKRYFLSVKSVSEKCEKSNIKTQLAIANAYSNLSYIYMKSAEVPDALVAAESALSLYRKASDQKSVKLGEVLCNTAEIYCNVNVADYFDKSIELLKEAKTILFQHKRIYLYYEQITSLYIMYGTHCLKVKKYEIAKKYSEKALKRFQKFQETFRRVHEDEERIETLRAKCQELERSLKQIK